MSSMRFAVDGWDPSYGASLETEGEFLTESTATISVDVEMPASGWHPVDARDGAAEPPGAVLFVDGVRRVEARVWIDDPVTGDGEAPADATPAMVASYAAGVVCCSGGRAHLVGAQLRRGLFSTAPHASDIVTRAGTYQAHRVAAAGLAGKAPNGAASNGGGAGPLMASLSQALQRRLSDVEMATAAEARSIAHDHGPDKHPDDDLLIIDGPLRGRQHLPRALGYIKSHRTTYLPPDLNAMVGRLEPGQRTPVFLMGTSWDRHTWYLRLPGPPGAPWSGIVRVECAADLPKAEVIRLANQSQACLPKFASAGYKDSRSPQNLYPIGGLERELRHRLGDPKLLYRALRAASARPLNRRLRDDRGDGVPELGEGERLGQIAARAEGTAAADRVAVRGRRPDQDRLPGPLAPEPAQDFLAADIGQAQVQQDQVAGLAQGQAQALAAGSRHGHGEPGQAERPRGQAADAGLIIDDQDPAVRCVTHKLTIRQRR